MKKTDKPYYLYEYSFFNYSRRISNSVPQAHFHETYEIYYLVEGNRRYVIEDKIYDIYPGDMILIPPMTTHKVWNSPDACEGEYHARFLLTPSPQEIPEVFLPCFETHYYHLTENEKQIITNCFEDLQHNQQKDKYTSYYNHANLIKILHTLAKNKASAEPNLHFTHAGTQMQKAASYIKEHCNQPLTLDELAKHYGFTKEYFSTIFKDTTGFGFNEYLNQMRIAKSINLLTTTTLSIVEISSQCGFNDSNYFSAVFKKVVGFPPRKFRETQEKRLLR